MSLALVMRFFEGAFLNDPALIFPPLFKRGRATLVVAPESSLDGVMG